MKKLYNLWLMAVTLLLTVACTSEVDDVFDQTAGNRIDQAIAEYQTVLRSASNGWVLNYYPSPTQEYGGYTLLVRFHDNGMADVSCELFQADKVCSGSYNVENSAGPMLTFNTYNEVFHFFTEPANALGIGDNGKGMEGDSDFLIVKCTNDEVILEGKKTDNRMVMRPLPAGTNWANYLQSIKQITREAYPAAYEVNIDNQLMYKVIQRYRKFILTNADGSTVELPFHYTPEGIRFSEDLSLATLKVKDLQWNQEKMNFSNEHVTIQATALPKNYTAYNQYAGEYAFIYNDGGTEVPVTLEEELFNESYLMKGLPINLRIRYNAVEGSIGLEFQETADGIRILPWAIDSGGFITQVKGVGLTGYLKKTVIPGEDGQESITAETINLYDNGQWGSAACDSFIGVDAVSGDLILQLPKIVGFYRIAK